MKPRITIQEVCPRDGLQIEPCWVPTAEKVDLIDRLSALGFSRVEAGSFVSPKAVPALRDGDEVFRSIARRAGTIFVALVPNLKGALRALDAQVDEINFVMSASETHNRANMGMDHAASILALTAITKEVAGRISINATVATAFGCPYEGAQAEEKILRIVQTYLGLGVRSVTLADTTGMANPRLVRSRVAAVARRIPFDDLTLHFHNTRGLGLSNVMAGYDIGAKRFDASLGGLGGCPFAPGASGNVCTEDLVNLCNETGIETGLDLARLIELARDLPRLTGRPIAGQVAKAGRAQDLHPMPEQLRRAS